MRESTRSAHDRVDAVFGGYDLSRPDDYASFLIGHAAAFLPIEHALDRGGAEQFLPDWNESRRATLLAEDLAELGIDLPRQIEPPEFASDAEMLGALYVIEGSRLGGAMLRHNVPDGQPSRFLSAVHTSGRWRAFAATLDRCLCSDARLHEATSSALQTFASFERVAARSIA
ncbi:MAG: biliverdin-producing heme oxygenase [Sphingomicrobium sp.]